MIINKLDIKGFGKLKDLEIEFIPGLNIVYGENEAGKSTIQWFIKAMFYDLKGGRERDGLVPPIKRFKPWENNQYGGYIEYTLNNGELYRISRNFNDNSVCVLDSSFNDITHSFKIGRGKRVKFAEEHLGLNETCFEKTTFIGQMDIKVDGTGKEEIINKLVNVRETGFEDISFKKAEKALKDAILTNTGTEKTSTRPLDKVNKRLGQLKDMYDELKSKRKSLVEIEDCINETKELLRVYKKQKEFIDIAVKTIKIARRSVELEKAKEELIEIQNHLALLENDYKNVTLRIDTMEKIYGFKRVDSVKDDVDSVKDDNDIYEYSAEDIVIKGIGELDDVEEIGRISGIGDIEEKIIGIKDETDNLKDEFDRCKESKKILCEEITDADKRRKIINAGIIITLLLAMGFIGFFFATIQEIWPIPVFLTELFTKQVYGLIVLGATIITFSISGVLLFFRKNANSKYLNLNKKKNSLEIYMDNLEEKSNSCNKEINKILSSYGAASIKEFFKIKAVLDEKRIKLKELETLRERAEELKNGINIYTKRASLLVDTDISGAKELKLKIEIEKTMGDIYKSRSQLSCLVNDLSIKGESLLTNGLNHKSELPDNSLNCELEKLVNDLNWNMGLLIKDEKKEKGYLSNDLNPCVNDLNRSEQNEMTLDNIREIEENLEACCEKVRKEENLLALRLKECETIINTSGYDDEQLQMTIEEIEVLESEKKKLEDIQFSLYKALDVMTEASLEIQKDYMPILNDRMSYYINEITNGRYKDLRADHELMLKVQDPENINMVPVLQLSGGTIDQMYLVLRLAMSDLISQKQETLPLIMDEVFAHFDDARIEESMYLLGKVSRKRQVIMFTCKGREAGIAREICKNANILALRA